ncbi:hypothetical protein OIU91_01375 [Streptomyces sp. NBC_01456]|uniref:hypothetical protein n=1 Tax=unclassified Streptomyces TaxID=2593676 RepID=UPI002E3540DE|nr:MULTISPECIES: hypothetical protein [unclassified Streptomyces]
MPQRVDGVAGDRLPATCHRTHGIRFAPRRACRRGGGGLDAAGGPERKRYAITEAGVRRTGDLADQLICDHALLPLEGDLRWRELTTARPDRLVQAVAA